MVSKLFIVVDSLVVSGLQRRDVRNGRRIWIKE